MTGAKPFLSMVIPLAGEVFSPWLEELLKVKGDVEFILVLPVDACMVEISDGRVRQIVCPQRGELIQRLTGLLNASGKYVLSINCDMHVHPDVCDLAASYFQKFSDSWVLRLSRKDYVSYLIEPWPALPDIKELDGPAIPIAPLQDPFDIGCFFRGRKDHHGRHLENFDKKIWRNDLVQEAIRDLSRMFSLFGAIKYIPFWCMDRLLGLYLQAKFFRKDILIGHWMPEGSEQLREEDNPPERLRTHRFYVAADILLLKRFPQYGYFWNLVIDGLIGILKRAVRYWLTAPLTSNLV